MPGLMEETPLTPRDYLTILRRRKWSFLVPTGVLFVLSLAAALLWPPTYQSTATVLVEEAEVPEDLVGTLVSDYVERRLEAITRRVMVTDNLIGIIERYGLYPEDRQAEPITQIVETMREDIAIETISAEIVDPQSGRKGEATVAFQLSFDYGDPETAQRVANELVSLYLNENLRQRRERATETTKFLGEERSRVEQRIAELEKQLTEFKTINNGALPEQLPYNQQMVARSEQELGDLNRQLLSLRDRQSYLATQLALIEPNRVYAGGAQQYMTPGAQVEAARAELTTLTARYGPSHPDVVKARRELAALGQLTGSETGTASLALEADRLRAELDGLRTRYSDDHPDVKRTLRQLNSVEASLRDAPSGGGGTSQPDNPAYMALQAQLEGIRTEIASFQPQREYIQERIRQYQELVAKTPIVEQEYYRLQRTLDDTVAQREDLLAKETTAQLGQALESGLKAERFSLIEPPDLPTEPVKPQRLLIVLVGIVLSMGGGMGTVALRHALDDTVGNPRDVALIIGIEPLGLVPRIVTPADQARRLAITLGGIAIVVLVVGGIGWYVHSQVIPIDTAAFTVWRWIVTALGPYLPSDLQWQFGLPAQ
jgi:polysaccharide biosynthesis transport protein